MRKNLGPSTSVIHPEDCIAEKEESGLKIFGTTLEQILIFDPNLKGWVLANSLRLWKAGRLRVKQLSCLLGSVEEITVFFEKHLSEALEIWHKRFLLKIDLNDADKSFPVELFENFEHFLRLVPPTRHPNRLN